MDDQLRTLIAVIKKLSKGNLILFKYYYVIKFLFICVGGGGGGALGACTFGELFTDTMDTMPALAATLLQAKKRDIVWNS